MKLAARLFAALLCALLPALAWAQTPIVAGPWTPGHVPMFVGAGGFQPVIQDSGPAAGGISGLGLGELMLQARGTGTPPFIGQGTGPLGTNLCDYDAPTNNATGYHWFCFSPNTTTSLGQGALIAVGAGGVAAQIPLFISVNGTTYAFPFALSGVLGPNSSTANNVACWNNAAGTLLKDCGTGIRTKLTATTNFFISNSNGADCGGSPCSLGVDNTTCGTARLTPCLTIQFATSLIVNNYDFQSAAVNFQLADGTYNECVLLPQYVSSTNQGRTVSILGHSGNPALTTVNCSGNNTFTLVNVPSGWILKDINYTSGGACIFNDYNSSVYIDGGNFAACTNFDVQGVNKSFTEFILHNYGISASTQSHVQMTDGAEVIWQSVTANITGSPTFSNGLLSSDRGGILDDSNVTFTGSYTGDKYKINSTVPYVMGTGATATTSNSTQYIGISSISNSEVNYFVIPAQYTKFVNLTVNATAAPGAGQTFIFTIRIGGSPTQLTCTISGAVATTCRDSIHDGIGLSGINTRGSIVDLQVVSSAGAATAIVTASFVTM